MANRSSPPLSTILDVRHALQAVLRSELLAEGVESTECPRLAEVVAVVTRLDDATIPYSRDEDAR